MIEETEKIEEYIQNKFCGNICCAYGCSLGGSFVALLMQRKKIHIEHVILGSSDLDQCSKFKAQISCKISSWFLYLILQGRAYSMQHEELLAYYPEKWVEEIVNCIYGNMASGFPFVQKFME